MDSCDGQERLKRNVDKVATTSEGAKGPDPRCSKDVR